MKDFLKEVRDFGITHLDAAQKRDLNKAWHRLPAWPDAAGSRIRVSFDKDFVRTWVTARCDPYKDEIPEIPNDSVGGSLFAAAVQALADGGRAS